MENFKSAGIPAAAAGMLGFIWPYIFIRKFRITCWINKCISLLWNLHGKLIEYGLNCVCYTLRFTFGDFVSVDEPKMQRKDPIESASREPPISKTSFFAGSLAIFSCGMLIGVYGVTRKEKTKISMAVHRSNVFLAMRAFGWGTALCLGTFAGAGALFMATTKVSSVKELDAYAKDAAEKMKLPKMIKKMEPKDAEEKARMDKEVAEIEENLNEFFAIFFGNSKKSDSSSNFPAKQEKVLDFESILATLKRKYESRGSSTESHSSADRPSVWTLLRDFVMGKKQVDTSTKIDDKKIALSISTTTRAACSGETDSAPSVVLDSTGNGTDGIDTDAKAALEGRARATVWSLISNAMPWGSPRQRPQDLEQEQQPQQQPKQQQQSSQRTDASPHQGQRT